MRTPSSHYHLFKKAIFEHTDWEGRKNKYSTFILLLIQEEVEMLQNLHMQLSLAEYNSNDMLPMPPSHRGFQSWQPGSYSRWSGLTWWAHGLREAASGVWKVTFFPWIIAPTLWLFPRRSWFPQCSEYAWRENRKRKWRVGERWTHYRYLPYKAKGDLVRQLYPTLG